VPRLGKAPLGIYLAEERWNPTIAAALETYDAITLGRLPSLRNRKISLLTA